MNTYLIKLRDEVVELLTGEAGVLCDDCAQEEAHEKSVHLDPAIDGLMALIERETKRSFRNGAEAERKSPRQTGKRPSALSSGKIKPLAQEVDEGNGSS